jgi:DNA-binding NtrC family response regulator
MEKIEESILKYAIEKAESNVSEAARMLGMSRPTFSYRLKKLNIEV